MGQTDDRRTTPLLKVTQLQVGGPPIVSNTYLEYTNSLWNPPIKNRIKAEKVQMRATRLVNQIKSKKNLYSAVYSTDSEALGGRIK